jgi:creatinine amidohydrolase
MFSLSHDDLRTAWSHRTWEDFAAAPASDTRIAILPLHGFADHGLGLPLHLEEVIGSRLLRDALAGIPPSEACVLPPLRHVVGPYAACSFSVDPDTALALIGEIAAGVHAAGFRKLVLLSSSPWATELAATAALEARVALGLHTYLIPLSGLGLDLHPSSAERSRAQAVGAALLGVVPDAAFRAPDCSDGERRPGYWNLPTHLAPDSTLSGPLLLAETTARLRRLLGEIAAHRTPGTSPALIHWQSMPELPSAASLAPPVGLGSHLAQLTPRHLATLTADLHDGAVALLPTGAIEQHGPHLPVGVDAFLGEVWTSALLPRLPKGTPLWIAPAITYGNSNEHRGFPGTLSVSAQSLRHVILSQARQLQAWGFRRLAILNTHGGNSAVLTYVLREVQTTLGLRTALLSVPASADLPAQERAYGFHGGTWETSLMLAAAPQLVRFDRAVCEYPSRIDDPGLLRPEKAAATFAWLTSDVSRSGVMGDATAARAELGHAWIDRGAATLAAQLAEFSQSKSSR